MKYYLLLLLAVVGCGGSAENLFDENSGDAMLRTPDAATDHYIVPGDGGLPDADQESPDARPTADGEPDGCQPLEDCGDGGLCVARLIYVPDGQGGTYGVDATEVTRGQYAAWLATQPSTTGQPAQCAWNTSFVPGCEWPAADKPNHPVVCVDWCDALAYCAGVGKRLCGKIGGGANSYEDFADASKSQWYRACSSGGKHAYPYGDEYEPDACNGADHHVGCALPAGSMAGCTSKEAGYACVFDLSGNVWEWEDSCNGATSAGDWCRLRGGSTGYGGAAMFCSTDMHYVRYLSSNVGSETGFRCCS